MQEINYQHNAGSSTIYVATDLITFGSVTKNIKAANNVVIITDSNVKQLYAENILQQLLVDNLNCKLITIPAGEQNKTRATKESIEDQMLEAGLGRDTTIIAVGGGVVTDISGYVAATYCRGIKVVYVPTTFLAMVDAAIGGKTAVNTHFGKNLIGCFYQPQQIFCDISTLETLSPDLIADGLAESIKHAMIADKKLFERMQTSLLEFNKHKTIPNKQLQQLVAASCKIKCDVVQQDETEQGGIRQTLNFGHTIAHAIERELNYSISHGQAVLAGLWIEAYLSYKTQQLDLDEFKVIKESLQQISYSKPLHLAKQQQQNLLEHICLDKKAINKEARFVLLNNIGSCMVHNNKYSFAVQEKLISEAIVAWSKEQQ